MRNHKPSQARFFRAYFTTLSILCRYIVVIVLKRFLGESSYESLLNKTHRKVGKKIVKNILILKGLYIKIGQTLSIMTNFLPPSFTEDLEQLQDAVPAHPYEEVVERFMEEFKKSPTELFAEFDRTPIASASLGQVHRARLRDGTNLAVKFQYPGIEKLVDSDLVTIKRIFGLVDFFFPDYGFKKIYSECSQIILQELDYSLEGKNLENIRDHFTDKPNVIFPKVYWDYSSKKILSTEFIDGIKVSNVAGLKKEMINPTQVAVSLIHLYCKQIFTDGLYHADPHPGNIIIQKGELVSDPTDQNTTTMASQFYYEPKIAMVDYGAVAEVSPEMRSGMALFVEGLILKDTGILSRAMKQMGFIAREENEETFDKIVEYFYSKIKGIKIENFKQLNVSQFQNLDDILELRKMDISFKELTSTFHVPKNWVLLERTLILMLGLVTHLDPYLNPVDIILPYVEQFVLGKDKKVADLIMQTTKEVLVSYINLPSEITKLIKKIQEGKISFSEKIQKQNSDRIYQGIHQLIYTLLLVVSLLFNYLFTRNGDMSLALNMKYISVALGAILFYSFVTNRK